MTGALLQQSAVIHFTLWAIEVLKDHKSFSQLFVQVSVLYVPLSLKAIFTSVWFLRCCPALEVPCNWLSLFLDIVLTPGTHDSVWHYTTCSFYPQTVFEFRFNHLYMNQFVCLLKLEGNKPVSIHVNVWRTSITEWEWLLTLSTKQMTDCFEISQKYVDTLVFVRRARQQD